MNRQDILNLDINTHGISTQEDMMIEECSELTKALLKLRRYHNCSLYVKQEKDDLIKAIKEEIADVQIMLDQMKLIYGSTKKEEEYKIRRLEKRLKGDTK